MEPPRHGAGLRLERDFRFGDRCLSRVCRWSRFDRPSRGTGCGQCSQAERLKPILVRGAGKFKVVPGHFRWSAPSPLATKPQRSPKKSGIDPFNREGSRSYAKNNSIFAPQLDSSTSRSFGSSSWLKNPAPSFRIYLPNLAMS